MNRYVNPSGNIKYSDEKELCEQLELFYFPDFFDNNWKPIENETKEVWISKYSRIDYYGIKENKETYVEVKNWFVKKRELQQIIFYKTQLKEKELYLICGGIEKKRLKILEENNIKTILVKDIKEINPEEVVYWM